MNTAAAVRPLYLLTAPDPIFALLHEPAGPRSGVAVVICAPFGWEDMASYRARRELAERLAARGHPVLRFDLPGTGDSGGGPRDADRLEAWTRAVAAAAEWLRAHASCPRIAAIGFGLGGLLACRAAARGAALDDLVLWGTSARGKALVRQLTAMARMEAAWQASQGGPALPTGLPEGYEAPAGYLLTPETRSALEGVDVTRDPLPAHAGRRVLLLERDGLDADPALRTWFESAGTDVSTGPGPGYGQLTGDPQSSETPDEVFERVAEWIGEVATPSPLAPPSLPGTGVADADSVELPAGQDGIRETPISVELPFGRLLGVLAEPVGKRVDLCAVLLNAGAQRRTGPNRMWVELARRWAAQGVPTLRLDLRGIGDSEGEAGPRTDAAFYLPAFVDQIRAALDVLEARGLPPRFLLLGKCSGAFWSLHTAAEDERVVAAFMLNPRILVWDGWIQTARDTALLRTQMRNAAMWRRALRRDVPLKRVASVGRAVALRAVSAPVRAPSRMLARRRARDTGGDELDHLLDALRDRGQRGVLLFAGHEPLHTEFERDGRLARWSRWPNVRLEHIPLHLDTHTLRPIWLQEEVHKRLDHALAEEIAHVRAA